MSQTAAHQRLFPVGHPLHALVRPTFHSVRAAMSTHLVSNIWMDATYFPERAGYRPSYDDLYGPGSTNVMPGTALWLSTGPGEGGNVVVFPASIDRTLLAWAERHGLLGASAFIASVADLEALVARTGRRVYAIDDLGPTLERHAVIPPALSALLNAKDSLADISAYAPVERVADMYEVTLDDFRALVQPGARLYLKTCNTESAGAGVFVCDGEAAFLAHLAEIRARQARWGLSRTLVLQPEIRGRNRSFQVFLDPAEPDAIQVITITDQLIEDDGKTYKGSINHPVNPDTLRHVGPVIVDLVARVRARFPEAFGIVMCDFFEEDDGSIVVYDPGIRPTGNTATAMARLYATSLTGREHYVSNLHLRSGVAGLTWGAFCERASGLTDPASIVERGVGLLPWGWNEVLGFGVLIGVAPDQRTFEQLRDRVLALDLG